MRLVRKLDAWQQRNPVLGPGIASFRKLADDDGNALAVALAWYGFVAISPLLLLVITIFGFVGADSLGDKVVSTMQQFPVIGTGFTSGEGASNIHGSGLGLVIGAVGLLYGAMGVTRSGQRMMARVWDVPIERRGGFALRLERGLAALVVIGSAFMVTAIASGFATSRGRVLAVRIGLFVPLIAVNVGLYLVSFLVLTPPHTTNSRALLPGSVLAGAGFTLLTTLGTGLVQHQLRNASDTYGAFASVIGIVTYLLLLATLTVYAAELNVVLHRRLWPRSLLKERPAAEG